MGNKLLNKLKTILKPAKKEVDEAKVVHTPNVYKSLFRIESAGPHSFEVSVQSSTYTAPYKEFIWTYSHPNSWQVVGKLLVGQKYFGAIKESEDGEYVSFKKVHKLEEANLYIDHYYEAIVTHINDKYVHVDMGYAFGWRFGTIQAKLSLSRNFSIDDRRQVAAGDIIKVINLETEQRNPKYITYKIQTEYHHTLRQYDADLRERRVQAWPDLDPTTLLGTEVECIVKPHHDIARRYCVLDNKHLCYIINKKQYNKGVDIHLLHKSTYKLREHDTCTVRIDSYTDASMMLYGSIVVSDSMHALAKKLDTQKKIKEKKPKEEWVNTSPYEEKQAINYRIIGQYNKGLRAVADGHVCKVPYSYFAWDYADKQMWQAVLPYLTDKEYTGIVNQVVQSGIYIRSKKVQTFTKPALQIDSIYTAMVSNKKERYVWIDVGYHFKWEYGAILIKLDLHKNFEKEERKSLRVASIVDVVYKNPMADQLTDTHVNFCTSYHIDELVHKHNHADIKERMWAIRQDEFEIGETYKVVVYKKSNGNIYALLDEAILCKIHVPVTIQPETELDKASSLRIGDTIPVRIKKVLKSAKMLLVVSVESSLDN